METHIYPYIFKRKSVRLYKELRISHDLLQKIIDQSEITRPVIDDFIYEIKIVDGQQLKGFLNFKPPMGLILYSQDHPLANFFAGLIMQKVDLLCSANGLGACWLGMASSKIETENGMKARITLSVGLADEPLHRENLTQFRRLDITQIRDFPYWDQLLEAVRVAPSATNGQPWYFKVKEESIALTFRKRLDVKDIFVNHLRWIDLGISCCHLLLAMDEHSISYTMRLNHEIKSENDPICLIDINRVL
jgi:hypothetical protein